ncbi:hypothetical protein IV203_026206 [Nitzschia inconspicua]|uniref:Uncharacterized protein n=1 Tax=Nitzschia inconspicua TaxID=303405 RepID=A0A9K3PXC3_9STRA|nr:hypothetical protein IV203_026206 [Nitzschia inconspicua]
MDDQIRQSMSCMSLYRYVDEPEREISAQVDTDGTFDNLDRGHFSWLNHHISEIGKNRADESIAFIDLNQRCCLGSH